MCASLFKSIKLISATWLIRIKNPPPASYKHNDMNLNELVHNTHSIFSLYCIPFLQWFIMIPIKCSFKQYFWEFHAENYLKKIIVLYLMRFSLNIYTYFIHESHHKIARHYGYKILRLGILCKMKTGKSKKYKRLLSVMCY